jgi:hypothetical protein
MCLGGGQCLTVCLSLDLSGIARIRARLSVECCGEIGGHDDLLTGLSVEPAFLDLDPCSSSAVANCWADQPP